eukprot:gene5578-11237_t
MHIIFTLLLLTIIPLNGSTNLEYKFAKDILRCLRQTSVSPVDEYTLLEAVSHERKLHGNQSYHTIICSDYRGFYNLEDHISSTSIYGIYHPIYSSANENRVCYAFLGRRSLTRDPLFQGLSDTPVPHIFKFNENILELSRDILKQSSRFLSSKISVLELATYLGIRGKLLKPPSVIWNELVHEAHDIAKTASIEGGTHSHWDRFLWTTEMYAVGSYSYKEKLHDHWRSLRSRDLTGCDFADFVPTEEGATLSVAFPSGFPTHCVLFLSTVASLRVDVAHISMHTSVSRSDSSSMSSSSSSSLTTTASHVKSNAVTNSASLSTTEGESSQSAASGLSATDQNAWVQSGNSVDTPYSAIGLDGQGYVVGLIDTGLDDLSCFFMDESGTATTRTARTHTETPVTEMWRRKVVQYIAWADSHPDIRYDHGTWCAGAVAGKCLDSDDPARSAYNGLAPAAKTTMFDVEYKVDANWLDVPSLYNIALPPAYSAGVRVHSNSWGTYGLSSYTSKALDIDDFMIENSDFIFIVAAGNSGQSGTSSVASPAVTKNGLTVGASDKSHMDLAYFSATGDTYDGRIKPDVVVPGQGLMSATGRNATERGASCNAAYSSGTSMATPIVSGAALLIKQYLENSSYWSVWCNVTYRACPRVSKSSHSHVSGTLIKAALLLSGEPLSYVTPDIYTPDSSQGWGQVLLANLLPIPGLYDFDLYVAESETLESLNRRLYSVMVEDVNTPLRVCIAWNDPVNVYWAAKSLLNDLDLMVTSPSGKVFYGNGRRGDERNPVERVVVSAPETGKYTISVTAKQLVESGSQQYALVITSGGYVLEKQRHVVPVTVEDLFWEQSKENCLARGRVLVRFQLEDWLTGTSWKQLQMHLNSSSSSGSGNDSHVCVFPNNRARMVSYFSRIYQCDVCLEEGTVYTAALTPPITVNVTEAAEPVRVSSPFCDVYLSAWQQSASVAISGGECNACRGSGGGVGSGSGNTMLGVLMFANVTDDDVEDYSWHGLSHWNISDSRGRVRAAGTLLVSDESAERYCLRDGFYTISLFDDDLFATSGKHAVVEFPLCGVRLSGAWGSWATVMLQAGQCSIVAEDPSSSSKSDTQSMEQRHAVMNTVLGVFGSVVGFGLVVVAGILLRTRGLGGDSRSRGYFVEMCVDPDDAKEEHWSASTASEKPNEANEAK